MTRDELYRYEYNRQWAKYRQAGHQFINLCDFQMPRLWHEIPSSSLTEHPENLPLPGSARIHYQAWPWKRIFTLLKVSQAFEISGSNQGPDHERYRNIWLNPYPMLGRKIYPHGYAPNWRLIERTWTQTWGITKKLGGGLMHITVQTWYDLKYINMWISGCMRYPTEPAFLDLFHGMKYLMHHPHELIMYSRKNIQSE